MCGTILQEAEAEPEAWKLSPTLGQGRRKGAESRPHHQEGCSGGHFQEGGIRRGTDSSKRGSMWGSEHLGIGGITKEHLGMGGFTGVYVDSM